LNARNSFAQFNYIAIAKRNRAPISQTQPKMPPKRIMQNRPPTPVAMAKRHPASLNQQVMPTAAIQIKSQSIHRNSQQENPRNWHSR